MPSVLQIFYAFRWQCTACNQEYGRHSNSIDVTKKVCACKGRLQFLGRFKQDGGGPAKARTPSAFSAYVQQNFAAVKRNLLPTTPASAVMKKLSVKWAEERRQAAGEGEAAQQGGNAEEEEVIDLVGRLNL